MGTLPLVIHMTLIFTQISREIDRREVSRPDQTASPIRCMDICICRLEDTRLFNYTNKLLIWSRKYDRRYGRFGHLWGKISESLEPVPRVQCLIFRHETFTVSLFHQYKGFGQSRILSWYVIFQELGQLCQIVLIRLWVK